MPLLAKYPLSTSGRSFLAQFLWALHPEFPYRLLLTDSERITLLYRPKALAAEFLSKAVCLELEVISALGI